MLRDGLECAEHGRTLYVLERDTAEREVYGRDARRERDIALPPVRSSAR